MTSSPPAATKDSTPPTGAAEIISLASVLPPPKIDANIVVDVGSNNLNTNTYVVTNGKASVLFRHKVTAKLAQGTRKGHRALREENVAIAVQELKTIRPVLDKFDDVRIVATSALRLVMNTMAGQEIIKRLEAAAGGRKIRILSGTEEARYMGDAIISEFSDTLKASGKESSKLKRAFIGIGGGSIQTGIIQKGVAKFLSSIPYGIRTLIEESEGKTSRIAKILRKTLPKIPHKKVDELYATGGNWRDIAKVIRAESPNGVSSPQSPNALILSFKEAKTELTNIAKGRFDRTHLDHRETQEIIYGAQALLTAMQHYKAQKVILCDSTMRQAIAEDPDFHNTQKTSQSSEQPPSSPERSGPAGRVSGQEQARRTAPAAIPA